MDGDGNNLKRKEPAEAFDLRLQSGSSNSNERAESSNGQAVNEANSSSIPNQQNHVTPGLGFAMMAGEHQNPWRNVRPRFDGSSFGSSVMNSDVHSQSGASNSQSHPVQHPDVLSTDVSASSSGASMACELCRSSFFALLQSVDPDPMLAGFDDFVMELTNCMHNNGEGVEAEPDFDLPEFDFDDWREEADMHYDLRLDIDDMSYEELLVLEEQIGTVSTGLTEDTISGQMRRYVYSQPNVSGPQIEEARCCICLEGFHDGNLVGSLDCGHEYHYDCIKEWLLEKNTCPLCKSTGLSG